MRTRLVLAVAATSVLAAGIHAQQAATAPTDYVFEASSVKPNRSGETGSSIRRQPGGRLNAVNIPLRSLITFAYQIQGFQLAGAPDWIGNERFDIVAKIEGDPPPVMPGTGPDPHMVAMRTLLADRFKLTVHRETRELDIYALVVARPEGKHAPGLRPTTQDCQRRMDEARKTGQQPAPPAGTEGVVCGVRQTFGRIQFGGMPLSLFANGLAGQVGRLVVDRTGLAGEWDFEVRYAPDAGPQPPGQQLAPLDPNAPSLFTAIQEQLGLKLEAAKGPVEVLVIDRVERPAGD